VTRIVGGFDMHRAQITFDDLDIVTGCGYGSHHSGFSPGSEGVVGPLRAGGGGVWTWTWKAAARSVSIRGVLPALPVGPMAECSFAQIGPFLQPIPPGVVLTREDDLSFRQKPE
jgi:hypothetical protein